MKTILHADDVERFRSLVRDEFVPQYEVVSLEDGDSVIDTARERNPDVVILDHLMPSEKDESGFDVCQQLREQFPSLPVVVFTGAWEDSREPNEVERIWGAKVVFKSEGAAALREAVESLLSPEGE